MCLRSLVRGGPLRRSALAMVDAGWGTTADPQLRISEPGPSAPRGGQGDGGRLLLRVLYVATWLMMSLFWAFVFIRWLNPSWPHPQALLASPGQDLGEHLLDIRLLLEHHNPYVLRPRLNDTTPPVTALFVLPLAYLPSPLFEFGSTWASFAALAASLGMLLNRVTPIARGRSLLLASGVLSPLVAATLTPVFSTFTEGQLHLWIMVMILFDLLVVRESRSGFLVGLATGIIFWPGLFVLAVVHRSRLRGFVLFLCGGLTATLAGVIVSPWASWHYFTHVLPSGEAAQRELTTPLPHGLTRFGFIGNQTLHGMLARPPLMGTTGGEWFYLFAAVLVGSFGMYVAWRVLDQGSVVLGYAVIGLTCLVVSPYAWFHHWVWVLLLPFAAIEGWRTRRVLSMVLLVSLLPFVAGLHLLLNTRAAVFEPGLLSWIRVNLPTLAGIVVLVSAAVSSWWAVPAMRARHGGAALGRAAKPATTAS